MKFRFTKIIAIAFAIMLLMCGCAKSGRVYPKSANDLDGLKAGAIVGTLHDQVIKKHYPNSEISFFTVYPDLNIALESGKIDYFVQDKIMLRGIAENYKNFQILDDKELLHLDQGYIFSKDTEKGEILCAQVNEYIEKCHADGTIERLLDKWTTENITNTAEDLDVPQDGPNGVIRMAISTTTPPFGLIKNDKVNGYDAEFITMFCKEYGYGLIFDGLDFGGLIPAITTGKDDIGGSSITITEERAQSVRFSEPYYGTDMVVIVRSENAEGTGLSGIKDSLHKTFITEDRWKMIIRGTLTTLLITFASTLFGTIVGLILFFICRKGGDIATFIFEKVSWVINGIPTVLLLLISFYIIFGQSLLSGVIISIIAFTITTSLAVCSMLMTSVKSVDRGQIEGAVSLGFTDMQTFAGIVLPQAMTQFVPNYKTMVINLLKNTAIVGYIAVEDLTRVADVIRSRTYEAFFPIIVSAIIYLLLIALLTFLINRVEIVFEPKKRSKEKILRRFKK